MDWIYIAIFTPLAISYYVLCYYLHKLVTFDC